MAYSYKSQALDLGSLRSELELLEPDRAIAVAVLDLDGFLQFNEREGTEGGDALLGRLEDALRSQLSEACRLAHVKGDEFAAALSDEPPESLLIALDAVRRFLADNEPVTLSGGVAGRPQHGESVDELLSAADTALVRSKRDGGNRISMAVDGRMLLKTSYYPPAALYRLAKLSQRTGRPEASLLREALDDLIVKHADLL